MQGSTGPSVGDRLVSLASALDIMRQSRGFPTGVV